MTLCPLNLSFPLPLRRRFSRLGVYCGVAASLGVPILTGGVAQAQVASPVAVPVAPAVPAQTAVPLTVPPADVSTLIPTTLTVKTGGPFAYVKPLLIGRSKRILPPPSTASRHPDLFAPQTVYTAKNNFLFDGAADIRYRTRTTTDNNVDNTVGSYVAASRLTTEFVRANQESGTEQGGARVQLLLENDNQGTALNKLRASEVYAFYHFPFPGVSATVRAGQFVLPFGLIAVYDTPLQPIQPLYEQALGLRVDTGVMLEGEYGLFHYAGAITDGAGPDRIYNSNGHVVTFRLSRAVETRLGHFQVGGSLLSGNLPITTFNYELPASGYVGTRNYVAKSRFAGDGEYFLGNLIARGEIIFGADNQDSVYGYFGEGNYTFLRRIQAVAEIKNWQFPVKPQQMSILGAGLNYDLGGGIMLRSLYEFERDTPVTAGSLPIVIRRVTLQTRLNF